MKWCCALFAVVSLGLGCSAGNTSVSSEQSNGSCPSVPSVLTGTAPEGAACSTWETCAPTCCNCNIGGSSNEFLAAECDNGDCANPTVACDDAQDSALCP